MVKEKLIGKREIFFLLILAVVLLALRLPHMYDPLNREEGLYAYAAGLSYSGDLPYKAVFSDVPPFIFYIYRAAFDLFGKTVEAMRNFTTLYVLFSMLLIYMLARTFTRASTAMMASFFYVMFLNSRLIHGFSSGPEVFTHFTVVFAIFFLLDRDKTYEKANFFLAGFLLSSAVLTSLAILPAAIVPVIYAMLYIKDRKRAGTGVLWYLFGFFTLVLLAVLWAVKKSILPEFFDAVIMYNLKEFLSVVKVGGISALFSGLSVFSVMSPFLAAGFVYSFVGLFTKKQDELNFVLFFMAVAIMSGSTPVRYIVLMPYLSLLAALLISDCMTAFEKMKVNRETAAIAGLAVILASFGYSVWGTRFFNNIFSSGEKDAAASEARVIAVGINSAKTPLTRIFVWPNEPEIYFYTGIRAGQRLVSSDNYWFYSDELRKTYAGLIAQPPDFFILEKGPDEILFEKLLKKEYSKSLEGMRFLLYKKGGTQ